MIAIVDCNSFYCSCERVFMPHLDKKPVVVLSNNDGCIISRTDEAKQLGVGMAGPYYQAKPIIEQYGVTVFSSNYNLYGDLSWRVMETLRMIMGKNNVEVYSVDEAFIIMDHIPADQLQYTAELMKSTVETWTGIKVSIGVAPTKVLAKVANRLSKKNKEKTNCILILDSQEKINDALEKTAVDDVWGVGGRSAVKLKYGWGITTALELSRMSTDFARKFLGGVTGVRLIRELRGEPTIDMKEEMVHKRMIATTRMFGNAVTDITSIKEAIATYTSRAAEKLRRQYSAAQHISIFVAWKNKDAKGYADKYITQRMSTSLPYATSFTHLLIKHAVAMVDRLYRKDIRYKKAGVILSGIVPDESVQGNIFYPPEQNNSRKLMEMMDNINFSQRNDVLKFASSGTKRNWKMRQDLMSPRYTTRWEEIKKVT